MKDLKDYLMETLLSESKETMVRVKLSGDEKSKAQDSLMSTAQKADIYAEKTDDGIKFKVRPGAKVDSLVASFQKCIDNIPEDKREEEAECIKNCKDAIAKLTDAAKAEEEETKEEKPEDKKEGSAEGENE